jgi:hypothetical protein
MTDPRDLERFLAQQNFERARLGAGVQSPDQLRGYGAASSPSQTLPIYKTMPKYVTRSIALFGQSLTAISPQARQLRQENRCNRRYLQRY